MGWIFLVGSYWGLYGRFHDDDGWSTTLIVGSLAYFVVAALLVALMIRISGNTEPRTRPRSPMRVTMREFD